VKRHNWLQVLRSPECSYPAGTFRWWCLWCEEQRDVMAPHPPIESGCTYASDDDKEAS
jgi:hypothetical protein